MMPTLSEPFEDWHRLPAADALTRLESSEAGLTAVDAGRRFVEHGPNELVDRGSKSPFAILWEQLTAIMVLIRRERDPADRRVHLLSLTTSGRALHDTVQQQIQRNEARLLGRLPAREQQRFLDAVRVLADRPERDLDTSAS